MPSAYEQGISGSLREISRQIELYSRRLARGCGLTVPQLVCLRQLAHENEMTPSAVARAVSLSQATVTGILDRLEKQALVTRRRDEDDKRLVRLTLTESGRELAEWAPSALHEQFSTRLQELHAGEQALIDWVLRRIVALMADELVDDEMHFEPPSAAALPVAEGDRLSLRHADRRAVRRRDALLPRDPR